jgi:hypothetical protein
MNSEKWEAATRDDSDVSPSQCNSYASHQAPRSATNLPRTPDQCPTDFLQAVFGHDLHLGMDKQPGSPWDLPSTDPPEGWLQKTPCGYWVGSVFIPRAWLTDKFHEARLDQAMLWTMYFSRALTAAIPIAITFVALVVSVSKKGCECVAACSNHISHCSIHNGLWPFLKANTCTQSVCLLRFFPEFFW